jgi:hypothetical protein
MSAAPETSPSADDLEIAAEQAIEACGGDAREAVKALIVANDFLEAQVRMLRAAASTLRKEVTEMSEVTYYVALPFVAPTMASLPARRSSA